MTKKEFLSALKRRLRRLSPNELKERIGFYSEIIDDKIEEGLTESEAVADVGNVNEIANQILLEAGSLSRMKSYKKRANPWQIALLIIGSPIWGSILITVFAVIWSVTITLWAVEIPLFIIGFISKYLLIACVEIAKFSGRLTKKCFVSIGHLFGA